MSSPTMRHSLATPSSAALSVRTELSYVVPNGSKPVQYAFTPPEGVPWESGEFEGKTVDIMDARSLPSSSLDVEGFDLWDAPTALVDADIAGSVVGAAARIEAPALSCVVWPGATVNAPTKDAVVTPFGTVAIA